MSWIRNWKTSKKRYSWDYIQRACKKMCALAEQANVTHIIGLSRGGLAPACIMANTLGIRKLYSIGVASYNQGEGDVEDIAGEIQMYQRIPTNDSEIDTDAIVLIVDDISDKGHTLNHVKDNLISNFSCKHLTASVFVKPKTTHMPDIYHKLVPDDQWIVFPWEE
jgi:hypoxanthine phosphoribosyltransferase